MAQLQDQDQSTDPETADKPVLKEHRTCARLSFVLSLRPTVLPARQWGSHNEQVKM